MNAYIQTSIAATAHLFEMLHSQPHSPFAAAPHTMMPRAEWSRRCAARLLELRPGAALGVVAHTVAEMWCDVSRMNPEMAAEMEHESGYFEH